MTKVRGHKLIIIAINYYHAKGVARYWNSDRYINTEYQDKLIWYKLYRVYQKAISSQSKFHNPRGYEPQTHPLFISDIHNNKFNTPQELIKFIEDNFLGPTLSPKYKVKTFQFLRVSPYVRPMYTNPNLNVSTILGRKKTTYRKPPPKIMPKRKVMR